MANNGKVIAIVQALNATLLVAERGIHDVAYIKAIMSDELLHSLAGSTKDSFDPILEICFGGNVEHFIKALRQYHIEEDGVYDRTAGRLSAITGYWRHAYYALEKTEDAKMSTSTFECACFVWLHSVDLANIGRVSSLIRKLMAFKERVAPASVSTFAAGLQEHDRRQWQLKALICEAMLARYSDGVTKLWFDLSDAFVGRIKGFDCWRRAIELRAQIRIFDRVGAGYHHMRAEILDELKSCFHNPDDAAKWLEEVEVEESKQ